MKIVLNSSKLLPILSVLFFIFSVHVGLCQEESYTIPEDSKPQSNVPKGTVTKHVFKSELFEGTIREYYVYVPQQYRKDQPAALMIFQDGHAYVKEDGDFKTPLVFD